MRPYFLIFILAGFLSSCTQNNSTAKPGKKAADKTREEVISFVENYLKDKLDSARIFTDEDGLITISNDMAGYKINQSKIVTGKIDEDKTDDAIVPVYALRGQFVLEYDHLIVLKSAGTYKVVKTMNDIFNIHGIENRKIIAEVSTVAPDSPSFGCAQCREVVTYKYRDGEMVRAE
jgi:hypothetical protein